MDKQVTVTGIVIFRSKWRLSSTRPTLPLRLKDRHPRRPRDEQWVRCAAKAIAEDGPEQFLVNMLYVLRQALRGAKLER